MTGLSITEFNEAPAPENDPMRVALQLDRSQRIARRRTQTALWRRARTQPAEEHARRLLLEAVDQLLSSARRSAIGQPIVDQAALDGLRAARARFPSTSASHFRIPGDIS